MAHEVETIIPTEHKGNMKPHNQSFCELTPSAAGIHGTCCLHRDFFEKHQVQCFEKGSAGCDISQIAAPLSSNLCGTQT